MITSSDTEPAVHTVVGMAITIEPALEHVGDLRVRLTGELDTWSSPTLLHALAGLRPAAGGPAGRQRQIVLDLHELSFLDTGGLAALEDTRAALLAAGWFVKAGPAQPQVCRLLRFAERAGWLVNGPLVVEQSSESHLHVVPTSSEHRRRARSVESVRTC